MCWQNGKKIFSVNAQITLRIDRKKLQFLVDRMDYWPKVPNILAYRFSLTKRTFSIAISHFVGNLIKKVPNHLQGSKNMPSKVLKGPPTYFQGTKVFSRCHRHIFVLDYSQNRFGECQNQHVGFTFFRTSLYLLNVWFISWNIYISTVFFNQNGFGECEVSMSDSLYFVHVYTYKTYRL